MHICYIYDAVYPWETGGVQTRVWELARRLAKDHTVHWYGLKYWNGPDQIERDGVTIHGVMEATDLYVGDRRSIHEAISFASRLTKPLLQNDFDVIDCQEFPYFPVLPSKLAALAGTGTLVLTWHEIWDAYWYDYLGWKGICGQTVERLTARLPDVHVAVSERTQRDARSIGVHDPHLVPNGIDLDAIRAIPPADREVDVLYAGRLIPEKGVDTLVDAIDQLRHQSVPELSCVIVGEGPVRERLERRIDNQDLGDVITILDFQERHEDVIGLIKAASVLALPSRREGFGITALEALACGTPVATINHPQNAAVDLLVDGTTGAIAPPEPRSFADALIRARNLSSEACIETASDYDWDRIAAQMTVLYHELC